MVSHEHGDSESSASRSPAQPRRFPLGTHAHIHTHQNAPASPVPPDISNRQQYMSNPEHARTDISLNAARRDRERGQGLPMDRQYSAPARPTGTTALDFDSSPTHSNPDIYDDSSSQKRDPKRRSAGAPDHSATPDPTTPQLNNYRAWVSRRRAKDHQTSFKQRFHALYKTYIIEGLLRQRPLPPSLDGRHIPLNVRAARKKHLIDERSGKRYISNSIRSSRYTLWSFIPKQLVFQFSKLANFYFLVVGIMQLIPGLSTTGTYTTIAPLMIFVAIAMAKEGYDDYRRYKLDKSENRSVVWILDPDKTTAKWNAMRGAKEMAKERAKRSRDKSSKKRMEEGHEAGTTELQEIGPRPKNDGPWAEIEWHGVRVGDIIRLRRDDAVPADIVLLHATGPNGIAYIETMALDGETNLKSKQASPLLAKRCDTLEKMAQCDATIVSEDPNVDLYNYEGRVELGEETMPLTLNEVVYRGSTLRNTKEVIGLVINTGEECKIRMNANKNVRAKSPRMQMLLNRIVLFLVIVLLCMTVGCTGGYYLWKRDYEQGPYLPDATVPFKQIFFGYIIMFNTIIPLSLYVSLEIIKVGQYILMHDVEMYDPETDTPLSINTTTILEDLGQVSYVFSDKTGTLTENKMRFRKMSIAGTSWLHDLDVRKEKEQEHLQRTNTGSLPLHAAPSMNIIAEEEEPSKTTTAANQRPSPFPAATTPQTAGSRVEPNTMEMLDYIRTKPSTPFSRKAKQFLLCLALCHTCLPETRDNGEITFQAASPDELALVKAAQDMGFLMIDRPSQSIVLQVQKGDGTQVKETYEVLDVIEFSSARKRMSIIVRMPDGSICILCKGADNVILPRLKQSDLAMRTATDVERRSLQKRSLEADMVRRQRNSLSTPRNSMSMPRSSMNLSRHSMNIASASRQNFMRRMNGRRSTDLNRHSLHIAVPDEPGHRFSSDMRRFPAAAENDEFYPTPRQSLALNPPSPGGKGMDGYFSISPVDEAIAVNDAAIFERCFQHVDEYASEGLRTLLFGYRYLSGTDYAAWKKIYREATTSLVNRQEMIEGAAELIEKDFDLAGATAIEDRLQAGVPETIDKLRRANVQVWMLTGDKRETAINIANSARICKPYSEIFILDNTTGDLQEKITSTLIDVGRGMIPHSVLVVDGQTLAIIENDDTLRIMFFDLVIRVDSVVCCRAAPVQKANLVKSIRKTVPKSVTLAIGDGANDIAMIQASHVGVGISGREGLQAARVADFSIAQFRFLERLLFVHGRWNYHRTGKYILATFWKEIVFYITQAQFQRFVGFSGTSMYESWNLTVFNVLFTSLPVILLGVFEKDLRAETLLAVPELYTYGQRSGGFNFWKYIGWMTMGLVETILIYWLVYSHWHRLLFTEDNSLFPMGQLSYQICIVLIITKLLVLELNNKVWITSLGAALSIIAWFVWNPLIATLYPTRYMTYAVHDSFFKTFGARLGWWAASGGVIAAVLVLELGVTALRRVYWPNDVDLWQEIERQGPDGVRRVVDEHTAAERGQFNARAMSVSMSAPPSPLRERIKAAGRSGGGGGDGDGDGEGTIKSEGGHERPVTGHSFG